MLEAFERHLQTTLVEKSVQGKIDDNDLLIKSCIAILEKNGYLVKKQRAMGDEGLREGAVESQYGFATGRGKQLIVNSGDGLYSETRIDRYHIEKYGSDFISHHLQDCVRNIIPTIQEKHAIYYSALDYRQDQLRLRIFVPVRELTPEENQTSKETFQRIMKDTP